MALAKLKIFEVYSHPRTNTGTGMPKWRSVSAPAQLLHPALLIGDVEACQSFTPHVIAEIGESSLGQGFAGLARPRAAHPEGERMIKRHDPAPAALPVGVIPARAVRATWRSHQLRCRSQPVPVGVCPPLRSLRTSALPNPGAVPAAAPAPLCLETAAEPPARLPRPLPRAPVSVPDLPRRVWFEPCATPAVQQPSRRAVLRSGSPRHRA